MRTLGWLILVAVAGVFGLVRATGAQTAGLSGVIVYWSSEPWPSIWAVQPDGSNLHRILDNRQNAKRPRLSPDRAWVAFDGTPPGQPVMSDFDIQLVRLDGTGLHTLTRSPSWDTDAQWSPDGMSLSFTRSPPRPMDCFGSSIWIVRRDGSGAHRVAPGCGARWSPDGARLVYSMESGHALRIRNLKTGRTRRLASTQAFEVAAGWSPDGRKILFTREYDQARADVFVMNANGANLHRLGSGFAACWSPDGSRILYTRFFSSSLFVMNRDGSHKHQIVAASASEPDWR
jgi:Tol biopolymer transport system component